MIILNDIQKSLSDKLELCGFNCTRSALNSTNAKTWVFYRSRWIGNIELYMKFVHYYIGNDDGVTQSYEYVDFDTIVEHFKNAMKAYE